jgi:hypothetical protein
MKRMTKRDIQISVKMTADDYNLFTKAAAHVWPKAPISKAAIVLGLARIGAESVLPRAGRGEKKP